MTQALKQHTLQLDSGDSDGTDYEWITGGSASNVRNVIEAAVIANHDAVTQTITISIKDTSGTAVFTIDYSIEAGDSAIIAELIGQVLEGDASIPEKVYIAFDTALGGTDTIDCRASSVEIT